MNVTETNRERIEALVAEWRQGIERGLASLREACRALAEAYDIDPAHADSLVEEAGIPPESIKRMIEVGRGLRADRLLIEATPGEAALARCDISTQRRYLDEPVAVVTASNPSEHRMIPVVELSYAQARQVFHGGVPRTLQQQRSFIEAQAPVPPPLKVERAYVVSRGKVRFLAPCIITTADLASILKEAVSHGA